MMMDLQKKNGQGDLPAFSKFMKAFLNLKHTHVLVQFFEVCLVFVTQLLAVAYGLGNFA